MDVLFQASGVALWFWLTALIGVVWLRRHFDINRAYRDPPLSPAEAEGAEPLPKLTMLIAAKDEEQNLPRCLETLLKQDYPDFEAIVINDLDEFAARDPRVRAVHIRELPDGWFGKNHAMYTGLRQASGEWLCFSDADCSYDSPQLLRAAVRHALRERVDFLSVLPRLEVNSFWEQIVQPPAGAVMVFWFPPKLVNNPSSRRAYANGAFMLLKRSAYEALGGHESFKATLNEDMHMARQAKKLGLRLRVIRGQAMFRVRMYSGLRQIWRGWSRIFYGCFGTFPRLLATMGFLLVFSLSPYISLVVSLLVGGAAARVVPWAALVAIVAQLSVMWRFYRMSYSPPGWSITYPLGAAICCGMALNAMTRLLGFSTNWRGTAYRGGA
jgi:chlorobactene glucosyltransferase